ncbi:MAG: hypothetical protein A2Z12_08140 [Actinobacteria bacterium RBG_16_68_21]|nr:MAG: hypothetical protein A2Z12_08140 [Actinobacteria bacterium RBG_16_68_21]
MALAIELLLDESDALWHESDAELCDGYVAGVRRLVRLQAALAARLAEIDRRRAHEPGHLTTAAFVRDRVGVSGAEAQRLVSEARGLAEHDGLRHAFASAEIDRPRVAMLLHAAGVSPDTFARDEQVLIDTVARLEMSDARRAVDYWRQAADRERFARGVEQLHDRRGLSVSETFGGMIRLDGDLDPESGRLVAAALESLVEPTFLDPTDDRTLRQRRVDALAEICADHLRHGDVPVSGGFRTQVTLSVVPDVLRGEIGEPCELSGLVVTPEAAQRIACDATVTRVVADGGRVLDVGRTTRVVPAAIRRALIARDGGCTHPGCDRPHRWCDAHHITHWADGGSTSLGNLRLLCRRHHRMAHEGSVRRE